MQIYMMVFNNVPLFPDWYLSKDDIFPQRLSATLLQMPLVASWLQHTDNLYLCRLSGESSWSSYKRLFLLRDRDTAFHHFNPPNAGVTAYSSYPGFTGFTPK